ncbi:FAD binding domain protein [Aureobasidium pullulans]|uniref:Delta(24)-sterol reductase n=1 Tax=Aureobasidium pullulans TaxID=5580 RepID=A0A4S9V4I2_AURPU|nr:FAD binding domain protein [Aureobasidium pullulans]THZ45855.1 FAD binding domain protein [Aureobasidium pullulans]THZ54608.1 FAD binding domain protein [Aureobasidium pullulans]
MQARRALYRVATTSRDAVYKSNFNSVTLRRPIVRDRSSLALSGSQIAFFQGRGYTSTSGPDDFLNQHNSAVNNLSARVAEFHSNKQKFRISHGSTNSTRQTSKGPHVLDVSALNKVLRVDVDRKIAYVEPNVPMDRLVEATLPYGLVPPVVMEFPGITAGGGYAGTAGESSSFKHGFFNHTIESIEMILATGEVVKCSPTERSDMFYGAAGAVGSFGVTTLIELRLEPAKKYVETTYHPVTGMQDAIETLEKATSDHGLDYVDGIMFSKTQGAVVTGRMTDTPSSELPVQTFSSAWDPWFYQHVQSQISKSGTEPVVEAVPLPEYLFRYDRGGFWVGDMAFKYFNFPYNKFTRWFLDDFTHTRMMYTALHASGESKRCIIQDLALPYSTAEKFVDYTSSELDIFPLWLCPLKRTEQPTMHPYTREDKELMLNIGVWGFGPNNRAEFVKANRGLEAKLRELGGMKWLYAQTYYTENEFWEQFDRKWYDELREKYGATNLPSVYDKVRAPSEKAAAPEKFLDKWPWAGFFGIYKAIQSKTYLQARSAAWRKWIE